MSNWVDAQLDVLASDPEEITQIEEALQTPCEELLRWVGKEWNYDQADLAAEVRKLVMFEPTKNLGYVDPSLDKARSFESEFKDRGWGIVWSHVHAVSRKFPEAVFLASYWDNCMSYFGKSVIRGGREIRCMHDGQQEAQGQDWVLPDIFAPYVSEYHNGGAFGSLWNSWVIAMGKVVDEMKAKYGSAPYVDVFELATECFLEESEAAFERGTEFLADEADAKFESAADFDPHVSEEALKKDDGSTNSASTKRRIDRTNAHGNAGTPRLSIT